MYTTCTSTIYCTYYLARSAFSKSDVKKIRHVHSQRDVPIILNCPWIIWPIVCDSSIYYLISISEFWAYLSKSFFESDFIQLYIPLSIAIQGGNQKWFTWAMVVKVHIIIHITRPNLISVVYKLLCKLFNLHWY